MTFPELRQMIADKRQQCADLGIEGLDQIVLVLYRKTAPQGRRTRLCERSGPYCEEIVQVKHYQGFTGPQGFDVVAYFDCQKILDFLDKEGL